MALAYSLKASFWREFRPLGTATFTVTYWSPRPEPRRYGMPLPRRRKTVPGCVPSGIVRQSSAALQVCAERRLGEADGGLAEHASAVALELVALAHGHGDQQVSGRAAVRTRAALSLEGHGLAVVYAGRYVHGYLLVAAYCALAAASRAGLVNYLACAAALRAGARGLHHAERRALRRADSAAAVAVGGRSPLWYPRHIRCRGSRGTPQRGPRLSPSCSRRPPLQR